MKIIVANYRRYQSRTLPTYPLWLLPVHRRRDLGQHDTDVLNKVLHLQPMLARAGRLQLDAVGLAVCILSVRAGLTQVRRGHSPPLERNHFRVAKAVIQSLERHRKRAKRRACRSCGVVGYAASQAAWQAAARWIRHNLLSPGPMVRLKGRQEVYAAILRECMEHARRGLRDRDMVLPETEVRDGVRLAVRYVRRGRTEFGLASLLQNPEFARSHLAEFIIKRRTHAAAGSSSAIHEQK